MAFSVRFSFSDFGVKFECIGSVVSYLIGRYVYLYFKDLNILGSSSLSLRQFVPSRLNKSALSV
ncbi:hypothetical protein [Vibrio gallaecicus]|uniref:hypothetical protein n=1 Tax=Vibrio gallaecicus TaxID=552386 RepID=UPI0025B49138|nr:hypothetical protein [Vibrio gallaecicus]MDN3617327.1 hypothetical protein [Vibrio gallaecicus]